MFRIRPIQSAIATMILVLAVIMTVGCQGDSTPSSDDGPEVHIDAGDIVSFSAVGMASGREVSKFEEEYRALMSIRWSQGVSDRREELLREVLRVATSPYELGRVASAVKASTPLRSDGYLIGVANDRWYKACEEVVERSVTTNQLLEHIVYCPNESGIRKLFEGRGKELSKDLPLEDESAEKLRKIGNLFPHDEETARLLLSKELDDANTLEDFEDLYRKRANSRGPSFLGEVVAEWEKVAEVALEQTTECEMLRYFCRTFPPGADVSTRLAEKIGACLEETLQELTSLEEILALYDQIPRGGRSLLCGEFEDTFLVFERKIVQVVGSFGLSSIGRVIDVHTKLRDASINGTLVGDSSLQSVGDKWRELSRMKNSRVLTLDQAKEAYNMAPPYSQEKRDAGQLVIDLF